MEIPTNLSKNKIANFCVTRVSDMVKSKLTPKDEVFVTVSLTVVMKKKDVKPYLEKELTMEDLNKIIEKAI